MLLKMSEIVELSQSVQQISELKLPIRTAYKLNQLIKIIKEEVEFYQSRLGQVANDFAARDESGEYVYTNHSKTSLKIQEDKIEECFEKLQELGDLEVEIKEDMSFTLGEFSSVEVSAKELLPLMPFIKE